ncbi:MAG: glycosyltransferase family 4 protein [Caldiserica bacterium]|nr:glycosyltransferase family 4 protein [Caldisericota bacterium]
MRVLLVHPHDIFSHSEPWTSRIIYLAEEFHKRGEEVKLAHFPLKNEELNWKNLSYPVISLKRGRGWGNFVYNLTVLTKLSLWADIIHFQKCFHYASLPAILSAWMSGRPVHYDWDDWEYQIFHADIPSSRLVGRYLGLLEMAIPHLVETVSVSSQNLYELARNLRISKERIFRAPVGADLEKFRPGLPSGDIRKRFSVEEELVIYMGQLHGGQYAELFIEAASILKKKYPAVTFAIVGGGYKEKTLQAYAERLDSGVMFTGLVPHEEIPRYINASDICVACFEDNQITRSKSPLKIAEYMACGKPVVASDVGEVRGMLGEAGILVPPGDSKMLSEGIEELLLHPEKREEMGKKGRERAEEIYNWKKTADNIIKAYTKALYGN